MLPSGTDGSLAVVSTKCGDKKGKQITMLCVRLYLYLYTDIYIYMDVVNYNVVLLHMWPNNTFL